MIKNFEKLAQTVDQKNEIFFGDIHFFLEDLTLLCLYIAKLEQLDCEQFFVGTSANSHYSMLELRDVKNVVVKITVYVSFAQKFLWYFL